MTPVRFLILGATGDLTGRYLLPAFAELTDAGCLPADTEIVGVAPEPWDDSQFQAHASRRLDAHVGNVSPGSRAHLVRRLRYVSGDVTEPDTLRQAGTGVAGPVIAYLALPPAVFGPGLVALASAGLGATIRVVVEKPFGTDLASARDLNRLLSGHFSEEAVFRIDHFLGKQTVQNILGLRFANRLFDPLWCSGHVERVDIVWDETVALEGRAGYYDHTGALRDMIQNHLLQLLCLVAMERPAGPGERPLRDAKAQVLRAVRRFDEDEVRRHTVRARYTAGTGSGRRIPHYVEEDGVDPERGTETLAEATLFVDNERWAGVPFRLRTGKALGRDRREIRIGFRPMERLPFGQADDPGPNALTLGMDPDRLSADLALNGAGDPFCLEPARWELLLAPQELSAYARLLIDVMDGDPSLSIRGDEAEESWGIVEPIVEAWKVGAAPMGTYRAGSEGPTATPT